MLLLFQISITAILLMIFVQDIKSRAVHWVLFPLLAMVFAIAYRVKHGAFNGYAELLFVNLGFVIFQLIVLTVWFSIKNKSFVNITAGLLGWGDVLFLICLVFCFSPVNLMLFYIASLILVLLFWSLAKGVFKDQRHIPLAGLQALVLCLVLFGVWFTPGIDITSDEHLIKLLMP